MTAPDRIDGLIALRGHKILVTGGSGGIGRATVELFLRAGAEVLSVDLAGRQAPPGSTGLICDLSKPDEIREFTARLHDEHHHLDAFVHGAGVTRDGVLWKMTDEDWDTVMAINLSSAFHLLRAIAPGMREARRGSIVLISSINGERGRFGQANYCASKAGLIALGRTAARELGGRGVRVNCIAPGLIETPMSDVLAQEFKDQAVAESALGCLGQPEDVARAALFLCSDLSRYVTGQVLRVDGGQCM